MAKKLKKKKNKNLDDFDDEANGPHLKEETIRIIYAILLFILALFFIFSGLHQAGKVGEETYDLLQYLLGVGYVLLPLVLVAVGVMFLKSLKKRLAWPKLLGAAIFLFSALGTISVLFKAEDGTGEGGFIGNVVSNPLINLFDFWVTLIFLVGLIIISGIVIFDSYPTAQTFFFWRRKKDESDENLLGENEAKIVEPITPIKGKLEDKKIAVPEEDDYEEVDEEEDAQPRGLKKIFGGEKAPAPAPAPALFLGKPYNPPPLSLLEQDKGKPGVGDIKANANIIKRTLQNFGINVEMDEISIGPSVTRYALKPAEGVKLARIVALQNDLSLALAAHPIRIEAPIPGKSLVGIEIPNSTKTMVGLGTLLSAEEFKNSDKPLLAALGKGISGKSHFGNLAKMPHVLIAGATGSGKSVTIHAIITSLLYRNSPDNMKFIMIDPKRVELTQYNKIPHLLTPVITEAKKAILALKWAAKEMDRRYDVLQREKVRDIESYHKTILAPALKKLDPKNATDEEKAAVPEPMPYIVVIIDELADLMQMYPRELESAIVRLAQMSRAVGIHLMIATQRPSVNVITGLIKANIPSRIALQVTSQIDSRTILDGSGAEKLLGAGDMLYMSGEMSKPQRIQSAFISEAEMKSVVKYLIDNYADELTQEINLTEGGMDKNAIFESSLEDEGGEEDDLYEEARQIVISAGKASTSYLQRKLSVGYARAARLIDMLEERGVIGPGSGSKPREVIGAGSGSGSSDESSQEESSSM